MFLPNLDKMKTTERVKVAMFTVVNSHELSPIASGSTLEEKACNLAVLPIESELSDWLYDAIACLDVVGLAGKFKKVVDIEEATS